MFFISLLTKRKDCELWTLLQNLLQMLKKEKDLISYNDVI